MSDRSARCAQRLVTISSQFRRERLLEFATRFSRELVSLRPRVLLEAQWCEFVYHMNIFSRGRRCFRFREMFGRASADVNKAQEASTLHARFCLLQLKDMDFLHEGGDPQSNIFG